MNALWNALLTNPFVLPVIMGGIVYQLTRVLPHAANSLKDLFSYRVTLFNDEEVYEYFDAWIGENNKSKNTRRLMLSQQYSYDKDRWEWIYTFGQGVHILKDEGRWYIVHRSVQDVQDGIGQIMGGKRQGSIKIISFGRSRDKLAALVDKIRLFHENDGRIGIFLWHGDHYQQIIRKRPRPWETVTLPAEQKARIINDVMTFVNGQAQYTALDVPYRRGYAFTGPPGTGKTSLAMALASKLKRDLYILNPNSVKGDAAFQDAVNAVRGGGILLIEDIDAVNVTKRRTPEDKTATPQVVNVPAPALMLEDSKLTYSGMLNAIDGVASRDGRLLIITTNHVELLDPALMRTGRIDLHEVIGPLHLDEALEMCERFLGFTAEMTDWFAQHVDPKLPITGSDLQNLLLKRGASD